ncbi:hypothetical protein J2W35_003230 [Variovorax boronicumulans]|uniref:hypothetical protein n=1 Tax=Variovorax boronicumulans TaxID=436515 RepID=UPI002780BE23|nr:hypothetical protein [Variovorax boronicumulans]MDQ0082871.1 hypothetical protein [Variovorax boronicumulans]
MIDRTYRCNLCRDKHERQDTVGLHWQDWPAKGWIEKPSQETENHLCMRCLSSIQALAPRCGQGFECNGGPTCGSDHK